MMDAVPRLSQTYVDCQGCRVRYHQVGSGPDILFIHGAPGSIEDWLPVKDGLAAKYRLTFYDRPGYGYSDALKGGYNQIRQADVAFALIEKLNLVNPVVVGHSFGGGIALAMAVRRPKQIKAFISVGARAYPKAKSPLIFHLLMAPILGRLLLAIQRSSQGRKMMRHAILKMFHPNESSIPSDFIETRITQWLSNGNMISLAHEDTNSSSVLREISQHYREIEQHFVVVHGSEDHSIPVEDAMNLYSDLKDSQLIILPNTGHMVQFIRTDELARIISKTAG